MRATGALATFALPLAAAVPRDATGQRTGIGLSQGVLCDEHTKDVHWTVNPEEGFRYIKSNSIPAFPVLDYCPFGMGGLYCGAYKQCPSGEWGVDGELCVPDGSGIVLDPDRPGADWGQKATQVDDCPNPSWYTAQCPQQEGVEDHGDCLLPFHFHYKIPLDAKPVSQEFGPAKYDRAHGVGLDGVDIRGPREAGGLSLDEANIVKDKCNGHPTPGMADARYHYHTTPHCAWSVDNVEGSHYVEVPSKHSPQLGWEFDGFGLFGHQDEGGSGANCTITCADGNKDCVDDCEGASECHCGRGWWTGMNFCRTSGDQGTCEMRPVTDECNGHFGPTPRNEGVLSYHYHTRLTPPYTVGCLGPSWQECAELHGPDANHYCSEICETLVDGVCVQRGYEQQFDIESVEFGPGYVIGQERVPDSPYMRRHNSTYL